MYFVDANSIGLQLQIYNFISNLQKNVGILYISIVHVKKIENSLHVIRE